MFVLLRPSVCKSYVLLQWTALFLKCFVLIIFTIWAYVCLGFQVNFKIIFVNLRFLTLKFSILLMSMNKTLFSLLLLCLLFVATANGKKKDEKQESCKKNCEETIPLCKRRRCKKTKQIRKCIAKTCNQSKFCSHVMLHRYF